MRPFAYYFVFGMLLAYGQGGNPPSSSQAAFSPRMVRVTTSLDADWRFLKGDAAGAEAPSFDDSKWLALSVPHDWSIEGPFDAKNATGGAGGFLPAGIGWYRKHFTLPGEYAHRRVFVEFDGVMANSDVWINGAHLGKRPYGYVSFGYELTGNLNFGGNKPNILAVRADNSGQPASRWYSGAGIYRHVRLVIIDPIHVVQWGTFVTTPQADAAQATARVHTSIVNQSGEPRDISLQIMIISPDGRSVGTATSQVQRVAAGQSVDFEQEIAVKTPRLWDLDRPNLYSAYLIVKSGSDALDDDRVTFGIRDARFEPSTGFALNGKHLK
ncbi:MAG: sugar-binding domain-containing protein, partial [Acidobacteriota bacterium]